MMSSLNDTICRIIGKWHNQLEEQYLAINDVGPAMQRAYICSPCSSELVEEVRRNVMAARFYTWYAYENFGFLARAPHAFLPVLLSDKLPAERALALRFGLELLEQSELLLVCGSKLSSGMKGEIARAAQLRIPIRVYNEDLYASIRKLVIRSGGHIGLVELHAEPCYLAYDAEQLFAAG